MNVTVRLFGALSEYADPPQVDLQLDAGATVGELRARLGEYLQANAPGFRESLLRASAFADSRRVLREAEPIPGDGQLAVLPPVSGG